MADNIFEVTVYMDIYWVGRGRAGAGVAQNNSNIAGVGPNQTPGTGRVAQTLRLQQREYVPNAVATPPTVANIVAALTSAAQDLGGQIDPPTLAKIQNWALGQE